MQAMYNPDPATSVSNVKQELRLIKQTGSFDDKTIEKCIQVLELTEVRIEEQASRISQRLMMRLPALLTELINEDWVEESQAS